MDRLAEADFDALQTLGISNTRSVCSPASQAGTPDDSVVLTFVAIALLAAFDDFAKPRFFAVLSLSIAAIAGRMVLVYARAAAPGSGYSCAP